MNEIYDYDTESSDRWMFRSHDVTLLCIALQALIATVVAVCIAFGLAGHVPWLVNAALFPFTSTAMLFLVTHLWAQLWKPVP